MAGYILVIFIMILFSAFFSASEISFNASNKMRLKKSAETGSKTAALAYKISENFTSCTLRNSHRKQPCQHCGVHGGNGDYHESAVAGRQCRF